MIRPLPQITVDRRIGDVREDRDPRPVRTASDTTSQRAQDSMVALVRQGQDASLRSLQVWAELARKLGPHAQTPADATVASLAYDPFAKLLLAHARSSTSSSPLNVNSRNNSSTPPPSATSTPGRRQQNPTPADYRPAGNCAPQPGRARGASARGASQTLARHPS